MQSYNKVIDHLSSLVDELYTSVRSVKDDANTIVKAKLETILNELQVVRREEYEALWQQVQDNQKLLYKDKMKSFSLHRRASQYGQKPFFRRTGSKLVGRSSLESYYNDGHSGIGILGKIERKSLGYRKSFY